MGPEHRPGDGVDEGEVAAEEGADEEVVWDGEVLGVPKVPPCTWLCMLLLEVFSDAAM